MRRLILAGLLAGVGCGGEEPAVSDTDNWWDVEGDSSDVDDDEDDEDEDDDDDDDDEDDDEDDEDDEPVDSFWGELDTRESDGLIGVYVVTEDGVDCDMDYPLISVASSPDCADCSEAWVLRVDVPEIYDGDACEAHTYGGLSGETIGVGVDGDDLYLDLGAGFERVSNGYADQEDDELFFIVDGDED